MELGALEAKTFLTGAQGAEVLSSFWDNVIVELKGDPLGSRATDAHVEEALGSHDGVSDESNGTKGGH